MKQKKRTGPAGVRLLPAALFRVLQSDKPRKWSSIPDDEIFRRDNLRARHGTTPGAAAAMNRDADGRAEPPRKRVAAPAGRHHGAYRLARSARGDPG